MRGSWFRSFRNMDPEQQAFVSLPSKGRYALVGPPGSGKTNLLLVRAEVLAGTGEKNILIITYTKTLAEFIRSGIKMPENFQRSQVKTFHSWASEHIKEHLGFSPLERGEDFDDAARLKIAALLKQANEKVGAAKIYSAIFVDEAQDLTVDELESLLCLSDNICICGDERQGIYHKNGLEVISRLDLSKHKLDNHFRIGHEIAHVADRLMPPENPGDALSASVNYDIDLYGVSTAELHPYEPRAEQFQRMLNIIRVQVDSYPDDGIGIFCGRGESVAELRERFAETEFAERVNFYGIDRNAQFANGNRIHVMTLHSCKGTEFRAVHIFGIEELPNSNLQRTKLSYTGVTRAKTSLNAYRAGPTTVKIEHAFAKPKKFSLADLLPDTENS